MSELDISVIGELNLDLVLYGLPQQFEPEREHLADNLAITLGSSSAIFAHNFALLGNQVGFSSCIGSDPFGEICLQRLAQGGVDVSRVSRLFGKTTGLTVILPNENGRFILTYPGTMALLRSSDLDLRFVLASRHLHVSSYFLQKSLQADLPAIFRMAKETGMSTSLDTNDDPEDLWAADLTALLRDVDVLLPNEREACKLAHTDSLEEAIAFLGQNVRTLVVKRGSQGSIARVAGKNYEMLPPSVSVVDTIGAGDSFDAGFLHRYIRGADIEDCLRYGNLTAALSVTRSGGTEAFRETTHREEFMLRHAILQ